MRMGVLSMTTNLKDVSEPKVAVKPPGPKTRELFRKTGDPLEPFPPIWGLPVVRQEGPWIQDVDGNIYLDFVSGKGVANVGHRHPEVVKALKAQADEVILGCTSRRFELAEKLAELTPGNFAKKVFFGSSGSDAVDGALKLARWATGRPNIISVAGAYHGQTYGALSASSTWSWMVRGFHPLPGFFRMPAPYCYRCPMRLEYPRCGMQCLRYLEECMFASYCPPEDAAAVIIEPVFGDMGWVIPPDEYFIELKKLCEKHGILFIADEVQTGFGRTGKWFAVNHLRIEPDIICLGKPIASGIPLSAMVARAALADPEDRADHFRQSFTLEAHALGCASALATIRVIESEKLLENCSELGAYLLARLRKIEKAHRIVGEARGRGLLCTLEIVRDRRTREPAPEQASRICRRALENGLYTMFMGAFNATCIRICPPLISTRRILDIGLDILEEALSEVERQ
jgi:4-aminobutyrate aminotransferase